MQNLYRSKIAKRVAILAREKAKEEEAEKEAKEEERLEKLSKEKREKEEEDKRKAKKAKEAEEAEKLKAEQKEAVRLENLSKKQRKARKAQLAKEEEERKAKLEKEEEERKEKLAKEEEQRKAKAYKVKADKEKADKEKSLFVEKYEGRKKQIEKILQHGIPELKIYYAQENADTLVSQINEFGINCKKYVKNKIEMSKLKGIAEKLYKQKMKDIENNKELQQELWKLANQQFVELFNLEKVDPEEVNLYKKSKKPQYRFINEPNKKKMYDEYYMKHMIHQNLQEEEIERHFAFGKSAGRKSNYDSLKETYDKYEQENKKLFTSDLMKNIKKDIDRHFYTRRSYYGKDFVEDKCRALKMELNKELPKFWEIKEQQIKDIMNYPKKIRKEFIEKYDKILSEFSPIKDIASSTPTTVMTSTTSSGESKANSTDTIELLDLKEKQLVYETKNMYGNVEINHKENLYEIIKLKRELQWINTYGKFPFPNLETFESTLPAAGKVVSPFTDRRGEIDEMREWSQEVARHDTTLDDVRTAQATRNQQNQLKGKKSKNTKKKWPLIEKLRADNKKKKEKSNPNNGVVPKCHHCNQSGHYSYNCTSVKK